MFKVNFWQLVTDILIKIMEVAIDHPVYNQPEGHPRSSYRGFFNFLYDFYYWWWPRETSDEFKESVSGMKIIAHAVDPHKLIMSEASPIIKFNDPDSVSHFWVHINCLQYYDDEGTIWSIPLSQLDDAWAVVVKQDVNVVFGPDCGENLSAVESNYFDKISIALEHIKRSDLQIVNRSVFSYIDVNSLVDFSETRARLQMSNKCKTITPNDKLVYKAMKSPDRWYMLADELKTPLLNLYYISSSISLAINKLASFIPVTELAIYTNPLKFDRVCEGFNPDFLKVCINMLMASEEFDQAVERVISDRNRVNECQAGLIRYIYNNGFGCLRFIDNAPDVTPEVKEFAHNLLVNSKDFMCHFNKLGWSCDSSVMDVGGRLARCNNRYEIEAELIKRDFEYINSFNEAGVELLDLVPGEVLNYNALMVGLKSDSLIYFIRNFDVPYNIGQMTDMEYRAIVCEHATRFRVITSLVLNPK